MAIHFAPVSGGDLTRDGSYLDTGQSWTLFVQINQGITTPAGSGTHFRVLWEWGDTVGSDPYLYLGSLVTDSNALGFEIWDGISVYDTATIAPLGSAWVWAAVVYNSTTHVATLYVNGVVIGTVTVDLSGVTFPTTNEQVSNSYGDFSETYLRVWQAALTPTQLAAEAASATVVTSGSLLADTALTTPNDLADLSGNGHDWTAIGPLTYATGPFDAPISVFQQVIQSRTYGDEIGNEGMPVGLPCFTPLRSNGKFLSAYLTPKAQAENTHPWSVPGTFSKLHAELYVPLARRTYLPIHWPDITLTVMKNDVDTGLTVTLPAGSAGSAGVSVDNIIDTLSVVAGDRLTMKRVGQPLPFLNGYSAHFLWSLTFTPDANSESGYASGCTTNVNSVGTGQVVGPWNGSKSFHDGNWNTGATTGNHGEPTQWTIVPVPGDLFRLDVVLDAPPGVGNSRTFVIQLFGVSQDGSGGRPDTRIIFTDDETVGFAEFTLPLAVLDYMTLRHDNAGGPTSCHASYSTGFRPTVPGQYALCFDQLNANPSRTLTDYFGGMGGGAMTSTPAAPVPPSAPPAEGEVFMSLPGGIDPFSVEGFIVAVYGGPGAGNSYVFTPRINLASPTGGPTLTVHDSVCVAQTNVGTLTMLAATDRMDMQTVPASTPNAVHIGWTFLLVSPLTPPLVANPVRLTQLPIEIAYDYDALSAFVSGAGLNWLRPPPDPES